MLDAISTHSNRQKETQKAPREMKNVKFTISLSQKSADAVERLKDITDAATDSEVFRNALRIHLMLVEAHSDGKQLFIRDSMTGDQMIPVTLFAPASE